MNNNNTAILDEIEKLRREILMLRIRRENWEEIVKERDGFQAEVIRLQERLAIVHSIAAEFGARRNWETAEWDYFPEEKELISNDEGGSPES